MEERRKKIREFATNRRSPSPLALLFLGAALYVLISSFELIAPILLSFLLVLLLTLALNPVVVTLRRWMGGRTRATFVIVTIFLVLAGVAGWAFYNPIQ